MQRFDQKGIVTGVMYIALGTAAALGSLQYPIGSFWRMGAGFFPLMISMALVLTGIAVVLIAVAPSAPAVSLGRWPLRNLALVTIGVTAFAVLIRPGGVILATAALVGVASFAANDIKPRDALLSLTALSLLTWVVFIRLLGLQMTMLPRALGV